MDGLELDLGDVILNITARVPGLQRSELFWVFGPFSESSPQDIVPGLQPQSTPVSREADFMAVLKADQKMSFSLQGRDEAGNPSPLDPAEFTFVFAVDDPSLVTLTDNGDGSGVVTATGTLGTTNLTADVTRTSDGQLFHGVAAVEVVTGDVEAISIEFSTPEEATPDTP